MNYLFDTSPEDLPDGKKKPAGKRRQKEKQPAREEADFSATFRTKELRIIGKIDDTFDCADSRCNARCHDIVDEYKGEWRIECVFCGTGMRVDAIPGVLDSQAGSTFVFNDGIFEGFTIDEVARKDDGIKYLQFCAKRHARKAVRDACSSWLDLRGTSA